jgi:hypothetical protein
MSSDSLVEMMEKYQKQYYESQGKNVFFKKSQKKDCAKEIGQAFPLEDMLNRTIFLLPGKNKLVFDYTVFKLFANKDNYDAIIQRVIDSYDVLLSQYPLFEVHIILDGFTVSAAERYKSVIQLFCNKCMSSETRYTQFITGMYLYYTPSMMETISAMLKPFIDPLVSQRIIMYSKADSPAVFKGLFESERV